MNGTYEWDELWGGGNFEFSYGIFVDSLDNIYGCGITYSYGSGGDIFVVKYDMMGNFIWEETWGGANEDRAKSVVVDSSGNVFVTGYTFSYGTNGDLFLVKINNLGSYQWYKTWGSSSFDQGSSISFDSLGNIIIAGNGYSGQVCVVNYSTDGTLQDSTSWGGPGDDAGYQLVLDSSDSVFVGGYSDSSGAGGKDMMLVKFNNTLDFQWNTTWGGNMTEFCYDIGLDASNNIYLSGTSQTFGTGIHLVKFNQTGAFIWNNSYGGSSVVIGTFIEISDTDCIYLNGRKQNNVTGYVDHYIVKVNTSGDEQWNTSWGYSFINVGDGPIALDSYENIYICGTYGSADYDMHLIKFDNTPPVISIISPVPMQLCGNDAPTYDLSIYEPSLDSSWYSLDNGSTNYTFTGSSGTINQAAWDAFGDEVVNITFYINDTLGLVASDNISVQKDTHVPNLTLLSPSMNDLFGNSSPSFDLDLVEPQLASTWYTVNGSANYFFNGTNGTIDQSAWGALGNGTVNLTFYANNTAGNLASDSVVIQKDSLGPIMTILYPNPYDLFRNVTIGFDILIDEPRLNETWYSLNNGANYSFSSTNGTINQTAWDACGNGTVTLRFYGNDTLGNLGSSEVTVHKDIIMPVANFTVNAYLRKTGQYFGFTFTGDPGSTPASFFWDFGDGENSTLQDPFHYYDTPGNYTISLTVTDLDGDVDTITMPDLVEVIQNYYPSINFGRNATDILLGDYVQFTQFGGLGDEPTSISWNFGDGFFAFNITNPIHQYNSLGNYSVTLGMLDVDGEGGTQTQWDVIHVLNGSSDEDNDGLTNYEELNVYGTNPWYSDSDGDGFSDGNEISEGTDPNDINDYPSKDKDIPQNKIPSYQPVLILVSIIMGIAFVGISKKLRQV